MFARIAVVAAALAAVPSAFAADVTIKDLSHETGVRERYIRMVVGARTPYPEYRVVFDRVERQLKDALGQDGYRHLLEGQVAAALEVGRAHAAGQAVAAGKTNPAPLVRRQQG
jgi:hypothetical protein